MRVSADDLTGRELDVLALVAAGLSDKLIGARLGIARSTTSNHVAMILFKLGAANRAEAVAIAMRDGIIELAPPDR
jgi:DNA-binding CsgD family transcriptional regulator